MQTATLHIQVIDLKINTVVKKGSWAKPESFFVYMII